MSTVIETTVATSRRQKILVHRLHIATVLTSVNDYMLIITTTAAIATTTTTYYASPRRPFTTIASSTNKNYSASFRRSRATDEPLPTVHRSNPITIADLLRSLSAPETQSMMIMIRTIRHNRVADMFSSSNPSRRMLKSYYTRLQLGQAPQIAKILFSAAYDHHRHTMKVESTKSTFRT